MTFLPVESNPAGSPLDPLDPSSSSAASSPQSLGTAIPQLKSPAPLLRPTVEPTILPLQPTSPSTTLFSPLLNGSTSLEPQIGQSSTSSTPLGTLDPDAPLVGSDVFTSASRSTSSVNLIETTYTSGIFVADSTGRLGVDYLFDGGGYQGQLGIFSLVGMELFTPGSPEFIREAARRALSNSESGYVLIDDLQEGARFKGMLGEIDRNAGDYLGAKSFQVTPNGTYALMLVPNGRVEEVVQNPNIGDDKRPLFSLVTANPNEAFHMGQIVDVTGTGNTFVFEDLRMDGGSDRDYNDIIFQVRNARGETAKMDDWVAPEKDWRTSNLGQVLIEYTKPYITPIVVTAPVLPNQIVPDPLSPELPDDSVFPAPTLPPVNNQPSAPVAPIVLEVPSQPPVASLPVPVVNEESIVPSIPPGSNSVSPDPVAPTLPEVGGESGTPLVSPLAPEEITPILLSVHDDEEPHDHYEDDPLAPAPNNYALPATNQPLIGIIDTGFTTDNPDIDYSRITVGYDRVGNDANSLLAPGEGSEHGTHVLGIIGATRDNNLGIDGINDQAPLWVGRAVGSGQWATSLVEFVDAAIASKQPNAVVNLSMDLTQVNPDGSVTTRYELTPAEWAALEYARQNRVLVVVAAGNDGTVMSALGQASQIFDNIITVGAAE